MDPSRLTPLELSSLLYRERTGRLQRLRFGPVPDPWYYTDSRYKSAIVSQIRKMKAIEKVFGIRYSRDEVKRAIRSLVGQMEYRGVRVSDFWNADGVVGLRPRGNYKSYSSWVLDDIIHGHN